MIDRLLCWLKGLWFTALHRAPISGHSYRETVNVRAQVQVLECEDCGAVSVGWREEPAEK